MRLEIVKHLDRIATTAHEFAEERLHMVFHHRTLLLIGKQMRNEMIEGRMKGGG